MGIVIAHHFTALSYVLRTVREAEKLAKNRYGRNAFVVTVLRRSGEQTRVGCRWSYPGLEDDAQPISLFTRFYELLEKDVLSPKFVYNLLSEAPTLIGLSEEAQISEIKRVLRRQWSDTQKKDYPDSEAGTLAQRLYALANKMDSTHISTDKKTVELHSDKLRYGLVETFGWLLVMAFLARKEGE
jgi:CRISPR-associated protein Cmr2